MSSSETVQRAALVVDDSRVIRRVLAKFLGALNFSVAEAEDGACALVKLKALPNLTLVLVDWNMPAMNGLAFVREVRADPSFSALRIVMVTSENATERVAEALVAGADEYLMKPFTSEMLAEKLALLGICGAQP